jgi:hypothetical protein
MNENQHKGCDILDSIHFGVSGVWVQANETHTSGSRRYRSSADCENIMSAAIRLQSLPAIVIKSLLNFY